MKKTLAIWMALIMLVTGCAYAAPAAQGGTETAAQATEAAEPAEEAAEEVTAEETAIAEAPAEAETAEETEETEEAEAPATLERDVVVLFTSDVHCGIDTNFGYVGLKAVKDAMEATGDHVLLVDDGDSIQGEPVGTVTRGEAIIKLMNRIGYDIAIPGNHEFDYGMDRFLELAEMAEYPYISCNLNREGELVFAPYVIKEFDGVKIAFVGITTPETMISSQPRNFCDEDGNYIYDFLQDDTGEKLYEGVQQAVDDARAEGAQYVIVMAHLGEEETCRPWTYVDVITNTTGIDGMLDGHSHDSDNAIVKNKDGEDVPRQACGTKLNGIGWLRISAEDGCVDTGLYTWNNDVPMPELLGVENEMSAAVGEARDALGAELTEVVAHTDVDLTIHDPEAKDENGAPIRIVRVAETNLGDLCADAVRDQSGAEAAFVNGGGVRDDIPEGDITMEDILKVHPFGNMLSMIEASGQQILDALEWGCRDTPQECGGFLQVSGMSYEIHTYVDSSCEKDDNGAFAGVSGEYRVKNVMIGGEPLDPERTYTLAAFDYALLNNGDGYTMFDGCKVLQKAVKLDNQTLIDYIAGTLGGTIGEEYADPYGEGRIIAVSEPPEEDTAEEAEKAEENSDE